jgi:ribonuclease HI
MNLELLKEIDEAISGRRYRFEWVRGHVGHPLNEAADVRARGAAEAFQRGRPAPAGPGFRGGDTPVDAGDRRGAAEPALAGPRFASSATTVRPEHATERATERATAYPHDELFSVDDLGGDLGEDHRDLTDPLGADSIRSTGELHRVSLSLSADELRRLTRRAAAGGLTIEEYLRSLI